VHRTLFNIESYAIIQVAALLLFAALAVVLCYRSAIRVRHAAALVFLYILCNFLIAKLLFDFVKAGGGRHTLFDHPALAHFLEGGYWGWPIAFLPLLFAYPLVVGIPRVLFYRVAAFLLPPTFAVQKVACFLAGCCYGVETTMPWAVVFPDDSLCEPPGVPVHPLQVYDAILPLVILIILVVVDYRGGKSSRAFLFPLMVALYALARFETEFFRPHQPGELLLGSLWLELGAALAVVLLVGPGRRTWLRFVQAGPR
jgi:phosphatidylglycerol:prolipoprotein diacylglycerol transferase